MSENAAPTTAFPATEPTGLTDRDHDAYGPYRAPRRAAQPHDGASDVKPEVARRHPVAYTALALSVVALLWLAIWSSMPGGPSYQKVRVGTQDCVSVPQDSGPAALYCRTSGLKTP